jgi:lysine decarboxylase
VGRLADGVADSVTARRGEPRPPASSTVWSLVAEVVMSPRDAYFAPRRRVAWSDAVGRIAAETAAPYPPGIPALAPGEVISREIVDALRAEAAAGSRMAYCSDPSLDTLLVVDE